MKKLVAMLVSLAAGIETGLVTYNQLSGATPGPQPLEKGPLGFVQEPSAEATRTTAPPSPWINKKK